jgi:hypothetical protein
MRSLHQFARALDRFEVQVQGKFARLRADLAVLIEAEGRPKRTPAMKRRERWTGPVSAEVHADRAALYHRAFSAVTALGIEWTDKDFAARHGLNVSEVSRWWSPKGRGIAPGSVPDISIRRALNEDIVKYEGLLAERTKHRGKAQIPNSSARLSHSMLA